MILAMFLAGVFLYPTMPDTMASHWGADGQVNGYIPKFEALFLMPAITMAIFLLLILLPKIDPKRINYAGFQKYYDGFLAVFVGFMVYIHILTSLFNRGFEFNMTAAIMPAMAVLFYSVGALLERSRQNWFVGIRTPWTLSSEKVWDKTNRLGAKIFKTVAVLSLAMIFMGEPGFIVFVVMIVALSVYLVAYSYLEFKKEAGAKK